MPAVPATEAQLAGHQVAMRGARPMLPAVLLTVTGCIREPAVALETGRDGPPPVAEALTEAQLTVFTEDAPSAAPSPRVDAPVIKPDPVRFRIGAGYGALARVDFAQCRERGLQAGYLRLRATFTRVGYVARASVASNSLPPPAALDCIADQLRQTGVPSFDGDDARLTKTYFVEPSERR
jgi:hypothetical protein